LEKLKGNKGLTNPSSPTSESMTEVNNVESSSISFSHDTISIKSIGVPISGTDMRLLIKKGYKGGGIGVNGQEMTHPLEVVQRLRFTGLGYIERECSKEEEVTKALLKPLRKEDDGNTS